MEKYSFIRSVVVLYRSALLAIVSAERKPPTEPKKDPTAAVTNGSHISSRYLDRPRVGSISAPWPGLGWIRGRCAPPGGRGRLSAAGDGGDTGRVFGIAHRDVRVRGANRARCDEQGATTQVELIDLTARGLSQWRLDPRCDRCCVRNRVVRLTAGTNKLLRTGMATAVTCAEEVTVTHGLR
jgi:hypothetical protein